MSYHHTTPRDTPFNGVIPLALSLASIQSLLLPVYAAPSSHPALLPRALGTGSGPSSGTNLSTQVWVPIVVIASILLAVAVLTCTRSTWRTRIARWYSRSMPSGSGANANGTRELTAEQLAGPATPGTSTPGTTTTTTTTNARPRRARRNRRTPSQISTRSLPAYMKEPGEQELVIYRGPTDMEDAPTTVLDMPILSEHDPNHPESPLSSLEMSRTTTREYNPMPDTPIETPLLQQDETSSTESPTNQFGSGQSMLTPPPAAHAHMHDRASERPSFETFVSEDMRSASRIGGASASIINTNVNTGVVDPRGEAPPYFEVVAMDNLGPGLAHTMSNQSSLAGMSTPELTPSSRTVASIGSPGEVPVGSYGQGSPPQTRGHHTHTQDGQEHGSQGRLSAFFGLFHARPGSVFRPFAASPAVANSGHQGQGQNATISLDAIPPPPRNGNVNTSSMTNNMNNNNNNNNNNNGDMDASAMSPSTSTSMSTPTSGDPLIQVHTRVDSMHSVLSLPTTSGDGHSRPSSRAQTPASSHILSPSSSHGHGQGHGHSRDRSRSTTNQTHTQTHRPSHSGGGSSVFSITSHLRSLTRQRSVSSTRHGHGHSLSTSHLLDPSVSPSSSSSINNPSPNTNTNTNSNFTSPSMISLNSISSPLTHTLVRTEITFPKSGPTPEQVRLISERESYKRFGVPFGRDAVRAYRVGLMAAAEASRSQVELGMCRVGQPQEAPSTNQSQSESSSLPSSSSQAQAQAQLQPPPSSFKIPTSGANVMRSESRASSVVSFATAEESLRSYGTSTSSADGVDEEGRRTPVNTNQVPSLRVQVKESSYSLRRAAAVPLPHGMGEDEDQDEDEDEDEDVVSPTPVVGPMRWGDNERKSIHDRDESDDDGHEYDDEGGSGSGTPILQDGLEGVNGLRLGVLVWLDLSSYS
ncbi:hypothetical protein NLI96_g12177 [Meripilus lineatus]|uniref:Uncharacterized protein n=1 Tax=Meripilus lineatus TaxID=2056292 RepID=A0AAD5UUF7_9APHY|nr:hypothetical protein NLI96_g12177 [Physisporinus lineatus]